MAEPNTLMQRLQPALGSLKKNVGRGLAVLGAGAALSSLAMTVARYQAARADKKLPAEFVLEVDLRHLKLVESGPTSPLDLLQGTAARQLELRKAVKALELAGRDPRVKVVLTKLGSRDQLGGVATIQELRGALQSFSKAASSRGGATTIAFSPAYGEAGTNGTLEYYLASACDKVYMQSSGQLGLLGLQSQMLFFRDLLDKIKVTPVVFARENFKTALHMFTQRGFTPEHKENVTAILKSLTSQMWAGISSSRGLPLSQVQAAVAAGPLLSGPAFTTHKLLDGLKYVDEVVNVLVKSPKVLSEERSKAKGDTEVDERLPRVPITKYLLVKELVEAAGVPPTGGWMAGSPWEALSPSFWKSGGAQEAGLVALKPGAARTSESAGWVSPSVGKGRPKVAVVTVSGGIVQGPVPPGGPPGRKLIDASKLSEQLARLAEARDVKAVVLRVSSPGGSALGSDTLHHALKGLTDKGKTLVCSMGDVAASGGMFLAVASDRILAQPGTITGSIGVIVGKIDARAFLEDKGVHPESVEEGSPNLTLLSPVHPLTADQRVKVDDIIDDTYSDFVAKVAAGRHMSVEAVRALAGGRVYTGEQALKVGLVDELGGLSEAVAAAKKLAGLPEEEGQVVVFEYPPKKVSFIVRLLQSSMGPALDPDGQPGLMMGGGWATTPSQGSGLAALAVAWVSGALLGTGGGGGGGALAAAAATVGQAAGGGLTAGGEGAGGRVAQCAVEAVQMAALLEGVVSCYAPDAQMLADSLN